MSESVVLAFDVGGTTIKARVFDAELTELAIAKRPSPHGRDLIDGLIACATELTAGLDRPVAAAGVALPGLIDATAGVAVRSVNLELAALDVVTPMRAALGVPVAIGHDVACAGAAVHRLDARAEDPFVAVIGTGIAGVSIVGGKPVGGVSGQAGELGHVVVRPDGPTCACGRRGCLEAVASAAAIVRAYAARSGRDAGGADEVLGLVEHDADAAAVWSEAVAALADGLLIVSALLAPGEIVLAGGLAGAGTHLSDGVAAAMRDRGGVLPVPPVRTSALGERAGVLGAGLIALDLVASR